MGWLAFLLIGLIAGFIAEKVMNRNHGLIKNLIVGVIGAVVGGYLAPMVGISYGGFVGTLIVATIGAIIVLWLFALLAGR
ncbi:GlsB/YeaQ/YmgE family stress response membrane protein [Hoeflea poritis]|uniref:GlsB/YeaQ/YmgE family stress response membrane protein n=1 Tax=Hoeflea poritis TaxID=2993659 RepID=A0ABT4VG85_9HYPH|nr:GlsB/YeaQ/YmgE family stress response membrane protein [Hoeflea poritis]MDA4843723.1 GlsB/YeaQ/YmgE family stress response membrane protein [Hoeflea poritis]